jgi:two-component system cell cycle response regulator
MNLNNEPTVDIALMGFNDYERLVMNSLFRVSGTYREWQQDKKAHPDCVLLDVDEEIGHLTEHASSVPIVAVGSEVAGKSIAAHITRPFRWAQILSTLDAVTQSQQHADHSGTNATSELLQSAANSPNISVSDLGTSSSNLKKFKTVGAVLVVNPKPKGWRHITAEVASLGYRVDHVSTGAAAALLLANFRYNCVILETKLPDQEGIEICRMLKKTEGRRRTASIILTTSRNPMDRVRSKFIGCDAFISKPVDREELARTLRKFLPEYILEQ